MSSKLKNELRELVKAKVITPEVSNNISGYYTAKAVSQPNKLFTIFGVLGSLLVGLGIILILAHNWDAFSIPTKTIWAFTPLVIGQIIAAYALFFKQSQVWKETAATFLFFAIGASIALVSQIYNIPGSMPSFLLTWIVLAAPLLYLLRSYAATLLFLIFSTAYACNLGYFNEDTPWLFIGLLAWVLPFYYRLLKQDSGENRTGILNWILPLSVIISLGAFVSGEDTIGFIMYVFMFGVLYNLGKLPVFSENKVRTNGFVVLGSVGTIVVLLLLSFRWIWEEAGYDTFNTQDMAITGFFGSIGVALLVYFFSKNKLKPFNLFQYAFLITGGIYAFRYMEPQVPMILTNLLVFLLGVFAIRIGAKKGVYSILNYGLLIITVLITCRFFDTEIPFVMRGLLFVIIGFGFFGTNYLMYKKQNKLKNNNHE